MENEIEVKIFFWVGTAIMLGLTFMILFLTVIYQKKVLKIKQEEAENLLNISLESEQKERKRIASDLHDGVMGDLNAVRNFISLLSQNEKDDTKKEIIEEVAIVLNSILNNVQGITYNLMPPLLNTLGLIPTLNDYFNRVMTLHKIVITANYANTNINVPSSIAYELYRMIQELTSNMVKHGNVKNIFFTLEKKVDILTIRITDDGVPFEFKKNFKTTSGMGLKNIASRAKQVGALIEQKPVEKGNIIEIRLKIN